MIYNSDYSNGGAGNVYLLVSSKVKLNVAENPIAVMRLYITWGARIAEICKKLKSHKGSLKVDQTRAKSSCYRMAGFAVPRYSFR